MSTDAKSSAGHLVLVAPLSGVLVPIEDVPDSVFSSRAAGDGIAIDPTSAELLAPCDGVVSYLHPSHHALTVRAPSGVEVLLHVGLETVALHGEGFTAFVAAGEAVKTGQPLILFKGDQVARRARSLITVVVITNGERVATLTPRSGTVVAGHDRILDLELAQLEEPAADAAAAAEALHPPLSETEAEGPDTAVRDLRVTTALGLHARPAAILAVAAKRFRSEVRLTRGSASANAKSLTALLCLAAQYGDLLRLSAAGPDAERAVAELARLVEAGLGDRPAPPQQRESRAAAVAPEEAARLPPPYPSVGGGTLTGLPASPGIAVGMIFRLRHVAAVVEKTADDPRRERRLFEDALDRAKVQLRALEARVASEAGKENAGIFAAHIEVLSDPDLLDAVAADLALGKSAAFAWSEAVRRKAEALARLDDALIAVRAGDLRDVGGRVLAALLGGAEPAPPWLPPGTILVAEDLTPSETASLERNRVVGFCTVGGGATSHVAILARSFDLPAVVGIDARVLDVADGTTAILDGGAGTLRLAPTPEEVSVAGRRQAKIAARAEDDREAARQPAVTTDGHRVAVVANARSSEDARESLTLGGEGIGLLRSEFLFLDRITPPTEDEQVAAYRAVAEALGPGRPLVIRTLDVGGDKPLPYLPIPPEANPFLGERGIRVFLDRPDLLRTQLRAILRAASGFDVRVMFPMISLLEEWRAAKALLEEERARLGASPIQAGIMVEVASAVLIADHLAREADFFSIGTNDLTQYTLAMDRGHPRLAPLADGLHPAVLQLIGRAAEAAHRYGRRVAVCGGIASDPVTVPFLVGLGVDELSVAVPSIPGVKARVRSLSYPACRDLAARALECGTAAEVRSLAAAAHRLAAGE